VQEREKEIRQKISALVTEYYAVRFEQKEFIPGETPVRYAGRVFDEKEIQNLVDSSLDFWLTSGRYSEEFEAEFADFVDIEYAMLTNSGSSANLIALSALTSHLLGDKRLKPGDEVITAAAGFPTTVNPIIQNGLIPVFVDIDLETYNINVDELEKAITAKTRAVMLAHTLANPFNLERVMGLVEKYDLWLVEDCCDALGTTYNDVMVGTFGHVATCSFYPAHHITLGEGGMVFTNDDVIARAAASIRDWGRDCYCKGGENNGFVRIAERITDALKYLIVSIVEIDADPRQNVLSTDGKLPVGLVYLLKRHPAGVKALTMVAAEFHLHIQQAERRRHVEPQVGYAEVSAGGRPAGEGDGADAANRSADQGRQVVLPHSQNPVESYHGTQLEIPLGTGNPVELLHLLQGYDIPRDGCRVGVVLAHQRSSACPDDSVRISPADLQQVADMLGAVDDGRSIFALHSFSFCRGTCRLSERPARGYPAPRRNTHAA